MPGSQDVELANVATLVTMAQEADAFAAACDPAARSGVFTTRRAFRRVSVFGALAAAAGVAIVAGPSLWSGGTPVKPRGPERVVVVPREGEEASPAITTASLATPRASARDIPMPASGDATVLLAVFGDSSADQHDQALAVVANAVDTTPVCGCTVFSPVAWSDDRPLSEIGRGELISAALARRCGGSGELQFVLAIQGPVGSLPATAVAARSLVVCVSGGPDACADEGNCFAAAALRCVPEGVDVLAETMQVAAK
jgi:hypothetical protein